MHGTVNDLAMRGARPLYLSVAMIIEEGFAYKDLETIVRSLRNGADKAGVITSYSIHYTKLYEHLHFQRC